MRRIFKIKLISSPWHCALSAKNQDLQHPFRHSGPLVSKKSYYSHHNSPHTHTHTHVVAHRSLCCTFSSIAIHSLLPLGSLWLPEQLLGCVVTRGTSSLQHRCILRGAVVNEGQEEPSDKWVENLTSKPDLLREKRRRRRVCRETEEKRRSSFSLHAFLFCFFYYVLTSFMEEIAFI